MSSVEAQNIKSLLQIADFPPRNLQKQLQLKPLVLYILGVPGSKDIILTLHKPQRDIITQYDVNSALYLLHYDDHLDFVQASQRCSKMDYKQVTCKTGEYNSAEKSTRIGRKALPNGGRPTPGLLCRPGDTPMTLIRLHGVAGTQSDVAKIINSAARHDSDRYPECFDSSSMEQSSLFAQVDVLHEGYSCFKYEALNDSAVMTVQRPFTRSVCKEPLTQQSRRNSASHAMLSRTCDEQIKSYRKRDSGSVATAANFHDVTSSLLNRRLSLCKYTFMSPWNGQCEFLPNGSGSIVKCLQQPPINEAHKSHLALLVSEMRVNLPSTRRAHLTGKYNKFSAQSTNVGTARSRQSVALAFSSTRTKIAAALQEQSSVVIEDEKNDPYRPDLSLARESAGGGFSGDRIKLGKLIVYDEGQQMLDLLIGANMAIWSGVFQRYRE